MNPYVFRRLRILALVGAIAPFVPNVASAQDAERATAKPPAAPSVADGPRLTTSQGQAVSDDQNSLRVGPRGPTLLEDFHFREKMTHFDHERMPERVVHARGAGAHGVFKVYDDSMSRYTRARVLIDPKLETPVFVRFSTVNGSRGSADTVRDARGFATKFYTAEGVWDLVGNNIPVFFIQDAIKFPDLVHAFKPEADDEIPQASTAHNTFWDFISFTPESMHMIMWVMSDRGIPRSFRMMDGFGVHTFRLVNARGESTFVKFHWKPLLGVHSLVWDEAQKIAGKDPDFHRRDLWDAIAQGAYPEYELAVQLLGDADADKLGVDVLDPTKIWPEDRVPLKRIGRMTLNRNPENFFAETEQVAFHTAHIVAGIDFSDDPLLQGRNFSYLDTQLNRFGTPNFTQLPINQPKSAVNNYQQDGFMRYRNRPGKANYEPNSLPGGTAKEAPASDGGFVSYPEQVSGRKVRARSPTFGDHYSQAALFYNSLSAPERQHVVDALKFELSKVTMKPVQQRMLVHLARIDTAMSNAVAQHLGLPPATEPAPPAPGRAPDLSQETTVKGIAKTRKVAILVADGVNGADVQRMREGLQAAGAQAEVVAPRLGDVRGRGGVVRADKTYDTADSVLYDAVYVPGGRDDVATLRADPRVLRFVTDAFNHNKPIAASGEGRDILQSLDIAKEPGVAMDRTAAEVSEPFITAIGQHRFWNRHKR